MKINDILVEFVTPQAVAQDPGLEREKDVDVIFFGKMPRDYAAETAWAALEEVLSAEYPAGSEKAQEKVKEVAFQGGAVVTTKPLSVAKKLVATFNGYGIKSRINGNLNEFAPSGDSGGSGDYFQALASAWYNGTFDSGSLQKGIKSQQDVERLLNRGIVCPDGVTRKYGIDYNSTFDGVVISSDDYYEHADHDETDSRTGKPFGPYDYMEFGDEELDESAKYRDSKYKDKLYTQEPPDYNDTREYDRAMFDPKPDDYPGRKELPGGGEYDRTDPLVRGAGIGRSGIKNNILDRGKRKGLPSRDQITSLKQSIRDVHGRHTRANLPENLTEFAPDSNDGGEDDALRNYARMWWAGDEATQMQIERALARMGWEIGEDEGGYDNGGVFVVRAGDENGNSYTSWAAEDLTEGMAEGKPREKEADYGADYQDMVKRVKKLAGLGPLKTVYDPQKRVYKNMPTAVQPKK